MTLARVHDPLRKWLVKRLGDAGGPRADDVDAELDSIISGVNAIEDGTTRIANVSYCIHRDFSTTNSAGGGPDVLHTFTLPANSLATNNDYLDVWYAGAFAANDRDKFVQAQFDGTSYEAGGALDIDGATGWVLTARIARISATSVLVAHRITMNALFADSASAVNTFNLSGVAFTRNSGAFACANLTSNAVVMRVRSVVGAGAAAADVFQNQSIINLCQQ